MNSSLETFELAEEQGRSGFMVVCRCETEYEVFGDDAFYTSCPTCSRTIKQTLLEASL